MDRKCRRLLRLSPLVVAFCVVAFAGSARAECPQPSYGPGVVVAADTDLIVAGDFDGDGKANDVAVARTGTTAAIRFFKRDAAGSFVPLGTASAGVGNVWGLFAGDLDGDRRTDLVASGSGPRSKVLLNRSLAGGPGGGGPTGGDPDDYFGFEDKGSPLAVGESARFQVLAIGDATGDGKADLIVPYVMPSAATRLALYPGNGDGTFRPERTLDDVTDRQYVNAAVGDLNGDGRPDAVAVLYPPELVVLLGDGAGAFAAPWRRSLPHASGTAAQGLALADFDRDGILDVAIGSYGSPTPASSIFFMKGKNDGSFEAAVASPAGTNPWNLAVGDLNRDGVPDLVASNDSAEMKVAVLAGKRDGGFAPLLLLSTLGPTRFSPVTLGDLNDDRAPDILTNGTAFLNANACAPEGTARVVPIVLDVDTGSAHYVSELALTNRSSGPATATLAYTATLGSKAGSGSTTLTLGAGEQRRIDDVLGYLRSAGLPLPTAKADPQQGGTLKVAFVGPAVDETNVAATARTTSATLAPLPVGRAGLAYGGVRASAASPASVTLFPLRNAAGVDRTNLAVVNTSAEPMTIRITLFSATEPGRTVVFRQDETLPPYGWIQYGSAQLLEANGLTTAWAKIDRTSSTGGLTAYAVINDAVTNDGSFVPPVASGSASATYLTVPVLVETSGFQSELFVANTASVDAVATIRYVESATPSAGPGGTFRLDLPAGQAARFPDALDWLRQKAGCVGPRYSMSSYVGSLRIEVEGVPAASILAGARVAARTPSGKGQFGLYLPGVLGGEEAKSEAFLYGLRSDEENRSNVAAVHTGSTGSGAIEVAFQCFDGEVGGAPAGERVYRTLEPGGWTQIGNFLRTSNVRNGWVRVERTKGTAPWVAYGVVNDGAAAAERTGDGAFVPMVK